MRYYLLFIFFILLNPKHVWAEVGTIGLDTSIDQSKYKHAQKYFLENYGKDDSTKALINYYFAKRETALIRTVVPAITGGLATFLVVKTNPNNYSPSGKSSGYAGLIFVPAFIVLVYSAGTLIDGQHKWFKFSRHKLLQTLIDYKSGKPLPQKTTRRKAFKYELNNLEKLKKKADSFTT
ncbi:MAG: hypothetical protein EOP43_08155 [Sphingobacteriaceae bacterium]|nr:MAG: hypothetical protein EOP43_08155 [Sphingobacteriaceae bacterium]